MLNPNCVWSSISPKGMAQCRDKTPTDGCANLDEKRCKLTRPCVWSDKANKCMNGSPVPTPEPTPCICPKIMKPVVCKSSGKKIWNNECIAVKCNNQTGCSPSVTPCTEPVKISLRPSHSRNPSIYASQPLRLMAYPRATQCGKPARVYPRVRWTSRPALPRNVRLYGSYLSIPANTLRPGQTYTFTATATANNSKPVSASVSYTVKTRPSAIAIIGGDRNVSSTGFYLSASVKDPSGNINYTMVQWSCTENPKGGACPAPLNSIANGRSVYVKGPVPAGNYSLTASYKGAQSTVQIIVQTKQTITVWIFTRTNTVVANQPLQAYAAVKPLVGVTTPVTLQWRCGKTILKGQTKNSITLSPAQVQSCAVRGKIYLTVLASAGSIRGSSTKVITV
jgi:hypothetical protein